MADANIVTRKGKLLPTALYLGDNGRCFCGRERCAGMTAFYTGRDLSGQKVQPLTAALVADNGFDATSFTCESCGKALR